MASIDWPLCPNCGARRVTEKSAPFCKECWDAMWKDHEAEQAWDETFVIAISGFGPLPDPDETQEQRDA